MREIGTRLSEADIRAGFGGMVENNPSVLPAHTFRPCRVPACPSPGPKTRQDDRIFSLRNSSFEPLARGHGMRAGVGAARSFFKSAHAKHSREYFRGPTARARPQSYILLVQRSPRGIDGTEND